MKVRIEYKSGKVEVTNKISLKDYAKAMVSLTSDGRVLKMSIINF
mgnify:CR=1|tara:strand:- start:440 stop:574 length:135 start_codon:yes stop_codon:yes gene_type:complete